VYRKESVAKSEPRNQQTIAQEQAEEVIASEYTVEKRSAMAMNTSEEHSAREATGGLEE
jgi:hypothetical protein